jgi:hypothetical protein
MRISKEGKALGGGRPSAEDVELIRTFARGEIDASALYTFPLVLCDNEADRDLECFDAQTVEELAGLFVGKSGITDHEWRSGNQIARIYRTEVVRSPERCTATGEAYVCLKAWAYMLRTEMNAALIADIEGGIKKEVSVGCSVRARRCSICGKPEGDAACTHVRGESYGGKLCCTVLSGAADAYEWSFVAVPAQRAAGVTKAPAFSGLGEFVASETGKGFCDEFAALKAEAALGRAYLRELRGEVKRLGLLCDKALWKTLEPGLETMDAATLRSLRDTLRDRAAALLPLQPQLPAANRTVRFDGAPYII